MIDLLSKPDSFNVIWLVVAVVAYDTNILIDAIVTLIFVRSQFKSFRFWDALKVSLVGIFFGAVTPSSTGGQPMQLYLMSKMNIGVGFGSALMTQKFIVYQIMTALFSIFSLVTHFDYFKTAFTGVWQSLFIVLGFASQMAITAIFLIISFSTKLTGKLISFTDKIVHKFKFFKKPDDTMKKLRAEVAMFHDANKQLFVHKKRLVTTYVLVFFQVLAIMSAPYFIYLSFDMPSIAAANGQAVGSFFDFVCIQAFVVFTSNLIPLPGASGGAELAFTMYFSQFFVIVSTNKIKPAILLWRFVSYYGTIIISAPFSYLTKGKRKDDIDKQIETNE
jgi:hypothetical protein